MTKNKKLSRRAFMKAAGGSIVSIGLPGVFVKLMDSENQALAAELRPDGRPRIPPGQHAVETIRNMGGAAGGGKAPDLRLEIQGEVREPMTLSLSDLMTLNQVSQTCDVHCVTGWTLLDSQWRGIQLKTIMDFVKIKENAGFVVFEASSGYKSSIPIQEAKKENVLLAHGFAGQDLPQEHGAPLRALVPDLYFYKSVKWLQRINFSAVDELGFYESMGYSNSADPWKEERYEEE